jgi:hypothetical protein
MTADDVQSHRSSNAEPLKPISSRGTCLQFKAYRFAQFTCFIFSLLVFLSQNVTAQQSKPKAKPAAARRISFAEGQKLLAEEKEGNLEKQAGKFTRTRLSDGRVLELFYPLTAPNRARKGKLLTAPGYGVLYESEAVLKDSVRVRHALEDLIPDGRFFVANVPQLINRLEKRLHTKLDYSRASLRQVDRLIAGFHVSHTTAQTDPQLFQELTAYYGEVLRRAVKGEWKIRDEKVSAIRTQAEPNITFVSGGRTKEIKPWSSVISAIYNEETRGIGLTKGFDEEMKAAQ